MRPNGSVLMMTRSSASIRSRRDDSVPQRSIFVVAGGRIHLRLIYDPFASSWLIASRMSDTSTIQIPCPDCGQLNNEPVKRVVENDVIPCSLCGGLIDLAADECRWLVEQAARLLRDSK